MLIILGIMKTQQTIQRFNCKKLRAARLAKNISQENMVSMLYGSGNLMARTTLVNYERGFTEPRISDLLAISRILGCKVEYFFEP